MSDTDGEAVIRVPDDMREWVEEVTGATVTYADRQAGGGRKEAWFVDVESGGETRELFLRWDQGDPASVGDPWTVRVEAEVYRALSDTEVPVATFIALHPEAQAMLATRVYGRNWFSHITDPAEAESTAQDFITHLAALHRLDPNDLGAAMDLEREPRLDAALSMHELVEAQLDEMEDIIAFRGGEPDPIVSLSLTWLRANIPDYEGPTVLVQGDTGPGNFMYADGKVTAVVDWELAHFGDPMDDIAWLTLRAVQEPFTDLDARMAEYEKLSGHGLDFDRVRYYRVLGEAKIRVMSHGQSAADRGNRPGEGGDPGAGLIFGQLHRRLCAEALADVMGLEFEAPSVPDAPPETERDALYDVVLNQMRYVVTPRISDGFATQRIKGLARVVKYLAAANRMGDAFAAEELDELEALLGERPVNIDRGREAVARANSEGRVSTADALAVLYAGIQRDNELLRDSSGALADRHYHPLG
jgi:aminoglycoside phosphotransferase (APT) family kinase protein